MDKISTIKGGKFFIGVMKRAYIVASKSGYVWLGRLIIDFTLIALTCDFALSYRYYDKNTFIPYIFVFYTLKGGDRRTFMQLALYSAGTVMELCNFQRPK